MRVLKVRNVQEALPAGLDLMSTEGIKRESRNGPVLLIDGPVATCYQKPKERVIFWSERDANPFFHLFESLWMLAGRQDVAFVHQFVKRMMTFSDDGKIFHSAYGYRWRKHFQFDQLPMIIANLKAKPDDRRQVLEIWDAMSDLGHDGRDLPCNTHAYFSINLEGALDMTVCNRSNDVIWGAYGANAVHFSVLQEYIAAGVGVPVGRYWQISNNYHAYLETFEPLQPLGDQATDPFGDCFDPYRQGEVEPFPMFNTPLDSWERDLKMFLAEGPVVGLNDVFFRRVVTPMWNAHVAYKKKDFAQAKEIMEQCSASDWKRACIEWLDRREKAAAAKKAKAEDDGVEYENS